MTFSRNLKNVYLLYHRKIFALCLCDDRHSYMHEAEVVVVQKILEGLRQSFVRTADQQTGFITWSPVNTKLTSEHLQL